MRERQSYWNLYRNFLKSEKTLKAENVLANNLGKKKFLFDFEYELSFEGDELLEITKINDEECKNKTSKEIAEYFEIILEMFNVVYRYIKKENSVNKLESYKRIIPKKISSL